MPYKISMELVRTRVYEKKAAKLLSGAEMATAEDEICREPEKWPVVSGTGGLRKARAGRGASGKSGGVRIIYYVWMGKDRIYFLDIYAKNEKENLSAADKILLKSIVKAVKEIDDGKGE
jgi:hypothetical protein